MTYPFFAHTLRMHVTLLRKNSTRKIETVSDLCTSVCDLFSTHRPNCECLLVVRAL